MLKRKKELNKKCFYGAVIIGEKGQIVIPKEARKKMKLNKGERLLIFGADDEMLLLIKFSQIEKIARSLSKKLNVVYEIIKKIK